MIENWDQGLKKNRQKRGVQSVEVGWQLVEAIYEARSSLSLKELEKLTGISASRAYTYLVSFTRIGLVAQDATSGRYDLGSAALNLGLAALVRTDVIETARVAMADCRDRLGTTTFLSIFGNMGPAIVYWMQGTYPVTVQVQAGNVLPVIGSATGNVFLAFLDDDVLRPHIERELGGFDKNDPGLQKRVAKIRKSVRDRGVATIKGGLIAEVSGISAPIFDHENRLRAAMTVIGARATFDISNNGRNIKTVREIAQDVSNHMGAGGSLTP